MSDQFNLEIVSPEKSFFKDNNVIEVIVPAFEGEMGILKDHISIISFLKPGIIKVKINNDERNFYVEDGIVEFKDNNLSILTSNIFDIKKSDKLQISDMIKEAESDLADDKLDDQNRFLISQKVEVLKSLNLNWTTFSVIFSISIHFQSKNSGCLVLRLISLSSPKNLIINHFWVCPLNFPFQIIPKRLSGKR